jgi:membrane-associated protein
MQKLIDLLLEFKKYIDPEFIIQTAGELALPVLILIIFAETGLMFGFFLPGDSLLFTAGLFTATGHIPNSIEVLVLSLIAAAIVGDQVGYVIGRSAGPRIFNRPKSKLFNPDHVRKTQDFYNRHGGKTIIIGRFIPIVRTFAPIVAGVAHLEYRRFVFYNVAGGIIWVVSMTLAGYFLGKSFPAIKDYIHVVIVVIILLSIIPIITTFLSERRRSQK